MPSKNQTNNSHTTFSKDLGLFDASMIGVGAMIGVGIFVLTGLATEETEPASLLAFAPNGLVILLTAFAYAELASTIPKAGGGYAFVQMAFPRVAGKFFFKIPEQVALYAPASGRLQMTFSKEKFVVSPLEGEHQLPWILRPMGLSTHLEQKKECV